MTRTTESLMAEHGSAAGSTIISGLLCFFSARGAVFSHSTHAISQ